MQEHQPVTCSYRYLDTYSYYKEEDCLFFEHLTARFYTSLSYISVDIAIRITNNR